MGDGKNLSVYKDRWIPRLNSFKIISPKILPKNSKVSDLITIEGQWDIQKIQSCFNEEDARKILNLCLSVRSREDEPVWFYNPKGDYSVRSGYHLAIKIERQDSLSVSNVEAIWKKWNFIWSLNLLKKVSIFLWRIYQEAIPTKRALFRRNIVNEDYCPIFKMYPETTQHAIIYCKSAKQIWKSTRWRDFINWNESLSIPEMVEDINAKSSDLQMEEFEAIACSIWYS